MPSSDLLMSEQTLQKIENYHQFLCINGIEEAGFYFKEQLEHSGVSVKKMSLDTFTKLLIQSKLPKIFAESGVYHDKRDWTLQEKRILGDISAHMPVSFFNDGGHHTYQNHSTPLAAYLAYVPGALLRSDLSDTTADLDEVIVAGVFNQQRFNELYERRLLPQLFQINAQAHQEDKLAAITIPGIGTEQFAGNYGHIIKGVFRTALEYVLEKHNDKLSKIDIVHYDPYNEDSTQVKKIGHIDFRVVPSSSVATTGQLAYPQGSSSKTHTLTSFVAWDHFSWPGNDFWAGSRATDDGVKAASTDTMAVVTGVAGTYNPKKGSYEPPQGFSTWHSFANSMQLHFLGTIYVISNEGEKVSLIDAAEQSKREDTVEFKPKFRLSKIQARRLIENYEALLNEFQKVIKQTDSHLLRCDFQMIPYILLAIKSISEEHPFEPELGTSGISTIKSLPSDPHEALKHLLSKNQLGDHFEQMIDHYTAGDTSLNKSLHAFQQELLKKAIKVNGSFRNNQEYFQSLSIKIDLILESFAQKIDVIGAYKPAAKEKAQVLLNTLKNDKAEAFTNPNLKTLDTFKNKTISAIQEANSILKNDLGWVDCLTNLMKKVVNTLTTCIAYVFSLGHSRHHGFFAIKQVEASTALQILENNLSKSLT